MKHQISLLFLFLATISFAQDVRLTAVFLTRRPSDNRDKAEIQALENEHLRSIGRLSENGILLNGGPLEGGMELLILNTINRKDTEKVLAEDPAQNLYNAEILSFELRYGEICQPELPYEMKTYSLIRYLPKNQIASFKSNSDYDMRSSHDAHIRLLISSGQVIAEGVFGDYDGGIIIYQKDAINKTIQNDPAIVEGYLTADQYTIWLNKGSFCIK